MSTNTVSEAEIFRERDLRQRELVPPQKLSACKSLVIGVGAVGRQVALQLAVLGAVRMDLFDPDTVETVNLATQGYYPRDLGCSKVMATGEMCRLLNPQL